MQILTVCRIDTAWGFRDVTGATYAQSLDINFVVEAAQRMAQRVGSHVAFTPEAEAHYRSVRDTESSASRALSVSSSRRFLPWLLSRIRGRRPS